MLKVITGSGNRFKTEMADLAESMREEGDMVIIDSMFHALPEPLGRKQFMRMILDADVLLVYNKEGYIGFHTCLEIVLAKVSGIDVRFIFPSEENRAFFDKIQTLYYEHMYEKAGI